MSEKLPKALYKGILRVGDVSIRCFVLDDGTRVVSGRGLTQAIGMKGRAEGALRIANHRAIAEYLGDELREQIQISSSFSLALAQIQTYPALDMRRQFW